MRSTRALCETRRYRLLALPPPREPAAATIASGAGASGFCLPGSAEQTFKSALYEKNAF